MAQIVSIKHLRLCVGDSGTLGLDLATGKYFSLDPECELTTPQPDDDTWNSLLIEALAAHGLISQHAREKHTVSLLRLETSDSLYRPGDRDTCSIRVSDLIGFAKATLWACLLLRWRGILGAVRHIQKQQYRLRSAQAHREPCLVRERTMAFLRLRTAFYTAHDNCLFDSVALTSYLLEKNVPATLVVGVRLRPFRAHAWVQVGGSVVNDILENVKSFLPVLAV